MLKLKRTLRFFHTNCVTENVECVRHDELMTPAMERLLSSSDCRSSIEQFKTHLEEIIPFQIKLNKITTNHTEPPPTRPAPPPPSPCPSPPCPPPPSRAPPQSPRGHVAQPDAAASLHSAERGSPSAKAQLILDIRTCQAQVLSALNFA